MLKLTRALALILTAAVIMLSLTACTGGKTEQGGTSAVGGTSTTERTPAELTFREADGTIVADKSDVKSATAKKDGDAYAVLVKFIAD